MTISLYLQKPWRNREPLVCMSNLSFGSQFSLPLIDAAVVLIDQKLPPSPLYMVMAGMPK